MEENNFSILSALNNPLILGKITQFLPVKSLKRLRIVNKLWFSVFSQFLMLKFPSWWEFLTFCIFYTFKCDEKVPFPFPYRRFNLNVRKLGYETYLDDKDSEDDSDYEDFENYYEIPFENPVAKLRAIKRETIPIRELSLYNFDSFQQLKDILQMTSESLEVLKIKNLVDIFEERDKIFSLAPLFEELEDAIIEEEIWMPKLRHIYLTKSLNESNKMPIQKLLKILHNSLIEISLQHIDILPFVLDCLMVQKPPNLKRINLNFNYWLKIEEKMSEVNLPVTFEEVQKLIQIAAEFKSIQINFYGTILNAENVSDFFLILSLYKPEWFNLRKNEKYFKNLQMNSIKKFLCTDKNMMSLSGLLYHFPNLTKIDLREYYPGNRFLETKRYKRWQKFEQIVELNLVDPIRNLNLGHSFPNLTNLRLVFNEEFKFKIRVIFNNLKKLKELYLYSWNKNLNVSDSNITGLTNEIIQELRGGGNSYEFLKNYKIPQKNRGIAQLTELQRCWLNFAGVPTWISLFFGFKFLPKLEFLGIHSSQNCKIFKEEDWKDEYWNIFVDNFENLESLRIFEGDIECLEYLDELPLQYLFPQHLQAKRPLLKITYADKKK